MKQIHELPIEEFEILLAWARYLFWSDLHRVRFEEWTTESNDVEGAAGWRFLALLSQWYASLWVVIEGWQSASFKDPAIDGLLNEKQGYCDLLRRYRNGVYHYQPRLIEPRLTDFLVDAEPTSAWAAALHHEFLRFFDDRLAAIPGKENQEELRAAAFDVLGWLPKGTARDRELEFEKLNKEAHQLVEKYGDSIEARKFIADVDSSCARAREALAKYREWHGANIQAILAPQDGQD